MQQPAEGEVRPFPKSKLVSWDCPHCTLWEVRKEDLYCSFCGTSLLDVSVVPSEVSLVARLVPRRILVLSNDGDADARVHIVPKERSFPGLVIEPEMATVEAGKKLSLKVSLVPEKLPKKFTVETVDFICRIDKDRRKTFPLRVIVRSDPRPELITKVVQFGRIEEGKRAHGQIHLRNAGGAPLHLKQVEPVGSRQLVVSSATQFPLLIDVGEAGKVDVSWDAAREDDEMPAAEVGFRLLFENFPDEVVVPARAQLYRVLLHVDRTAIRIDPAVPKREYRETLKLENRGTVDVAIGGIDSDQAWLEVLTKDVRFNLKAQGGVAEGKPDLAATPRDLPEVKGSQRIQLLLHPKDLAPGLHHGEVRLWGLEQSESPLITVKIVLNVVEMHDYEDYLGIDFGTTNSVIAYLDRESQVPVLIEDAEVGTDSAPYLIPSILVFREGLHDYVIGSEARVEMASRPDYTIRSIKRLLGFRRPRSIFGEEVTASDIAGLILARLVERAEIQLHSVTGKYFNIRRAIISVPANFFGPRILGVLEACEHAGLDTEKEGDGPGSEEQPGMIVDEPSAAALHFLSRLEDPDGNGLWQKANRKNGLHLLVFDYGGGTLDVSVAQVRNEEGEGCRLTILSTLGDNEIGGDMIDLAIMKDLVGRLVLQGGSFDWKAIVSGIAELREREKKESWRRSTLGALLAARGNWKNYAEELKISLSDSGPDSIHITIPSEFLLYVSEGRVIAASESAEIKMRRDEMIELLTPFLDSAETLVRRALKLAKVSPNQIDYIFHAGRQSLLEPVRERIKAIFPKLPIERDCLEAKDVKVCVAKGAARYASLWRGVGTGGIRFENRGRILPVSYGYAKKLNLTQLSFVEVIPRGSTYPVTKEVEIPAEEIQGRVLDLRIYQNRGTKKRIDSNPEIDLLGHARVDSLADGVPGCTVTFSIDANRSLEVFADGVPVPIEFQDDEDQEEWMW